MIKVSVICTAYNHEDFVEEALRSVMEQTYREVELIVIDNASTDGTAEKIRKFCSHNSGIRFISNAWNKGLCTAFNQGLRFASGKYIIDLSADDVLLPDRIARQVAHFESLPEEYGVIYSNAQYLDAQSTSLHCHYVTDKEGKATENIPDGDVYLAVLKKYFICTPTMMMRRSLLDRLGGYDESLTYEDFDFWVRSAVICKYSYQDEVLTQKRILRRSLSTRSYEPGSGMLESTYVVCNKAYDLNRNQAEFDALALRIRGYIRKCFFTQEFELAGRFRQLLNYIEDPGPATEFIVLLCRLRLPFNWLYRVYYDWKIRAPLRQREAVATGVTER
ncbi:glycosyltransferase [Persicitalea jodogahamensis]|uniref:Glycosyltransferase 2-like domain-containing protein n=1 Tax=Persicitalea jodogahamensis TaxID=402147 RepID=A0A8J3D6U7_9BACT|nr:glycosyltransferase [Persicitalea jodogahamensis]GHB58787.1 hypothetical protein GCM10007390_10430 [Persicitalea jodogahamensis]